MRQNLISGIAFLTLLTERSNLSAHSQIERAGGVIVRINVDAQTPQSVRLEVISDEIIRVTTTAANSFSTHETLMLVPGLQKNTPWDLSEEQNEVTLSTPLFKATVNLVTGEVVFVDPAGTVLLKEQEGGGKSFIPRNVESKPYFSIQQKFFPPPEEAFYGLDGHQNDQMNCKNEDVDLVQENIADVIPFLYSNRNYRIPWDNYSGSKSGDARENESLKSLTPYNTGGPYSGDEIKIAL